MRNLTTLGIGCDDIESDPSKPPSDMVAASTSYVRSHVNTDYPDENVSYELDSQVGIINEEVVRDREETYILPSGIVGTLDDNIIKPSYINGKYGFEIFETRSNRFLRSQEFAHSYWVKEGVGAFSTPTTAPDTTTTASFLRESTTNSRHRIYNNVSVSEETQYTMSYHLRAGGRRYGRLRAGTDNGYIGEVRFDLQDGIITGTISDVFGEIIELVNGWYRISITFTTQTGATTLNSAGVYLWDAIGGSTGDIYQGDGVSGMFIWGAQIEEGASASPYRFTSSSVSTRLATNINVDTSEFLNKSEGTFIVEFTKTSNEGTRLPLSIGTSFNGSMWINIAPTTSSIFIRTQAEVASSVTTPSTLGENRISVSYTEDTIKISANGGGVVSSSHTLDTGLWEELTVGRASWSDSNYFNDSIHSITYYPSALSDSELISTSTLDTSGTFKGAVESITNGIKGNVRELTSHVTGSSAKKLGVDAFLYVFDQKPSGTGGGTATSGAWQTRDLLVINSNSIGATLASNTIRLLEGDYYIEASAPAYRVNDHQIRLRDVDINSTRVLGTSERSEASVATSTRSFLSGQFSIASSRSFEIQHRVQNTFGSTGFGQPVGWDESEIYTVVKIWKV